jgi:hypothetical protein
MLTQFVETAQARPCSGLAGCSLTPPHTEAFVRLRAYAHMQERRLADVAADVVAHRLRFSPDTEPERTDEGA